MLSVPAAQPLNGRWMIRYHKLFNTPAIANGDGAGIVGKFADL
jgi:hypothetical protein